MSIPAIVTLPGKMTSTRMGDAPGPQKQAAFERVLIDWQLAVNEKHYTRESYTHPSDQVHGHFGKQYARLDIGGSGAFMVGITSGIIYGIKGYGKVDTKKVIGNIYEPTFDVTVLVRDRFRHGRFQNQNNGSPSSVDVVKA